MVKIPVRVKCSGCLSTINMNIQWDGMSSLHCLDEIMTAVNAGLTSINVAKFTASLKVIAGSNTIIAHIEKEGEDPQMDDEKIREIESEIRKKLMEFVIQETGSEEARSHQGQQPSPNGHREREPEADDRWSHLE